MNPAAIGALAKGDFANAEIAITPGGIQAQEKDGQLKFVSAEILPKNINKSDRENLCKLGFLFGNDVDELFVECKLPAGWSKRATSHQMWSDLLDGLGRVRARIFYKAAFYDRRADFYLLCRLKIEEKFPMPPDEFVSMSIIREGVQIEFIGAYRPGDLEAHHSFRKSSEGWLKQNYPDWKNPLAYW